MSMPLFTPGSDPGSSFPELLRRTQVAAPALGADAVAAGLDVPHATTCVALRFDDGVVMAGDRRATSGNLISHRGMEKVVQADRFSGVAIAGAAGPAMEMIKLFQLQLEHYEKVEGQSLSLEGKANQLSMMVRGNLPAAMQGMVVVPIFAGYDLRRSTGRLWTYDVTGGRYEEQEFVATGSGSLHASTVIKVTYRPGLDRQAAVRLACRTERAEVKLAVQATVGLVGDEVHRFVEGVSQHRFPRLGPEVPRQVDPSRLLVGDAGGAVGIVLWLELRQDLLVVVGRQYLEDIGGVCQFLDRQPLGQLDVLGFLA